MDQCTAHFAQSPKGTQNATLAQLKTSALEHKKKEGVLTYLAFYVVGRCGGCKFRAQYLGVQILECTAEPLISLTILSCGLSELWERASTLDEHEHVTGINSGKKTPTFQQSREFLHRRKPQENSTDK